MTLSSIVSYFHWTQEFFYLKSWGKKEKPEVKEHLPTRQTYIPCMAKSFTFIRLIIKKEH